MEELQIKTRKQILKDKKDTRICLRVKEKKTRKTQKEKNLISQFK